MSLNSEDIVPEPFTGTAEIALDEISKGIRDAIARRAWETSPTGHVSHDDVVRAYEWYNARVADEMVFARKRPKDHPERRESGPRPIQSQTRLIQIAALASVSFCTLLVAVVSIPQFTSGYSLTSNSELSWFVALSAAMLTFISLTLTANMIVKLRRAQREGTVSSVAFEFLTLWKQIEGLVESLAETAGTPKGSRPGRLTFGAALLRAQNADVISAELGSDIRSLVRVRNRLVHGDDARISIKDTKRLQHVYDELVSTATVDHS